ncbi:unnamed protein product [Laminaria digitata]
MASPITRPRTSFASSRGSLRLAAVAGGRGAAGAGAAAGGGIGGVGSGSGLPAYGEGFEVRSCVVLDVSAEEGGRQLREVHANADRDNSCARENGAGSWRGNGGERKGGGGSGSGGKEAPEMGAKGESKAEAKGKTTAESAAKTGAGAEVWDGAGARDGVVSVFVHCGVNGGASKFAVETQGFNEATFGAPDEQGYCPTFAPVDAANPDTSHCRVTTLPVEMVLERLRNAGWGREHVSESADAGRFVCNYVYYTSLGLCEQAMAAVAGAEAGAEGVSAASAGAAAAAAAAAAADEEEDYAVKSVEERREEEGRGASSSNGGASTNSGGGGSGNNGRPVGDRHCVFLHVPPFKAIPKEKQIAFLVDCLSAIAASTASAATSTNAGAAGATGATGAAGAAATTGATAATLAAAKNPGAASSLATSASSSSSPRKKTSLLPSPKRDPSASSEAADPPVVTRGVSFAPMVEVGIANPLMSSIWDSAGSPVESSPPLPPPPPPSAGGVGGGAYSLSGGRNESRGGKGVGVGGKGVGGGSGADEDDSGYAQDDDYEEPEETVAENTRWRLVEAGFDELDVDAAMATTGSDQIEVNMQFLMDVAQLLPRGAPSDPGALYLRDFGNSGGSGSGESFGRSRGHSGHGGGGSGGGGGGGSSARGVSARGKEGVSPARMGGVSPKWVGAVSPGGRVLKSGSGGFGMTPPTPPSRLLSGASDPSASSSFATAGAAAAAGAAAGSSAGAAGDRGRSSTASESTEDGGGGGGAGEYCRQTTGNLYSHSPSPVRAGGAGAAGARVGGSSRRGRCEVIAGWGATLPSGPNLRLALLVRQDLGLGRGAVASQCSRAALAASRKAEGSGRGDTLAVWRSEGESMVVLGATDAGTLDAVLAIGAASGLAITMVREKHAAWVGSVSANTCTVAALGPAPMSAIRAVAGGMPLL